MSNKLKKDILCDNFTFMPVMSGAPRQGGHISHQTTTFQPFKFSDVIQNKYFQSENNMEDILTENSEVHYKFQSLPHSVIAHGWIPFVVSDFILIFKEISCFTPRWSQSSPWYSVFCTLSGTDLTDLTKELMEPPQLPYLVRWKKTLQNLFYVLHSTGLFISLLTSILVPVDIFLVSYMKNNDGEIWNVYCLLLSQ